MKRKEVAVVIVMIMCFALFSCGKSGQNAESQTGQSSQIANSRGEITEEAATDASYDAAAYEAAAQAVRDEFIQVIEAGIDDFDEEAHPEIPWYTAVLTRSPENRYYESYYDFDDNGVPEMVIAIGGTGDPTPVAIYTFDGQNMHYLFKDYPLGERSYLSRSDNMFIIHGSGGASSGILALYRIAEDGWSADIVDVIDYEYSDAEHVTYTSEYGRISPEEVVNRGLADSVGLDASLDWNCFYPHSLN